ncbi:hypothetical protein HDU86_002309 [Geranomyces michiganensis]|nr:hypothetical protein HDU86_002309 [Geranomyces michiganensis]
MLRTPWGQEDSAPIGSGRASADIAGGNRANNRNHTAGGRSQIVFGNYHEPASSSYKSMTSNDVLLDHRASLSSLNASAAIPNDYASRLRSRDNSSTDVFNIKAGPSTSSSGNGAEISTGYGAYGRDDGLPPQLPRSESGANPAAARGLVSGASSNGSLRMRDRQVPTPFDVPAGTAGSPMREHRSSSDIFHTQGNSGGGGDDGFGGGGGGDQHDAGSSTAARQYRSASDIFHVNEEGADRRYAAAGPTTTAPYAVGPTTERRQQQQQQHYHHHNAPPSRERAVAHHENYSPERNISTSRLDYQSPHKEDYAPATAAAAASAAASSPTMMNHYAAAAAPSTKFGGRDAGAYSPSPMTALRRGSSFSNSVLVPSDAAAAAAEDAAFKGRRHYPQYHRSSNIFQN